MSSQDTPLPVAAVCGDLRREKAYILLALFAMGYVATDVTEVDLMRSP